MSFNERWEALVKRTPKLADDESKMTISVASFRYQLRRMYDADREKPDLEGAANDFAAIKNQKHPFDGIFKDWGALGDIFGRKK